MVCSEICRVRKREIREKDRKGRRKGKNLKLRHANMREISFGPRLKTSWEFSYHLPLRNDESKKESLFYNSIVFNIQSVCQRADCRERLNNKSPICTLFSFILPILTSTLSTEYWHLYAYKMAAKLFHQLTIFFFYFQTIYVCKYSLKFPPAWSFFGNIRKCHLTKKVK